MLKQTKTPDHPVWHYIVYLSEDQKETSEIDHEKI